MALQCAAKTLQNAEIAPAIQLIEAVGIEKSHNIIFDETAWSKIVEMVKEELKPGYLE
jgi:uncharacterized metal-binding protein